MRLLNPIALVLVIVGALNWALVGLFEFDLVAEITGDSFGETNPVSRIVYVLVGAAGVYLALPSFRRCSATRRSDRGASTSRRPKRTTSRGRHRMMRVGRGTSFLSPGRLSSSARSPKSSVFRRWGTVVPSLLDSGVRA